jgi:hypothetical protein
MPFDESQHPRGEHGRWAVSAGGTVEPLVDPRVLDVGGDQWNKDTAARLENEYEAARPALNALVETAAKAPSPSDDAEVSAAVKANTTANFHDLENSLSDTESAALISKYGSIQAASTALYGKDAPGFKGTDEPEDEESPESWDEMNNDLQEQAGDKYKESNYEQALESEQNNWSENGAPAEAAAKVAEDDDWKAEFLTDYLAQRIEDGEPAIPYTAQELLDSITLNFDHDSASGSGYGSKSLAEKYLEVGFDDSQLQHPHNNFNPDQMTLPGIEEVKPESSLTEDMRKDITEAITDAFIEKTDKETSNMEAPDYLSESANDLVAEDWDQMGDKDKFQWVKNNTDLVDDEKPGKPEPKDEGPLLIPTTWNPMQDNDKGAGNYTRTQRMAKYLANNRAVQVMAQRGVQTLNQRGDPVLTHAAVPGTDTKYSEEAHPLTPTLEAIEQSDERLWSGWKGSSTGAEGRLLQVASADELGGRLREAIKNPDMAVEYSAFAKSDIAKTGTLEEFSAGLKASSNPVEMAKAAKSDPDTSFEQKQKAQEIIENPPTWKQPPLGEKVTLFSGTEISLDSNPMLHALGSKLKLHDGTEIQKQPDGKWKATTGPQPSTLPTQGNPAKLKSETVSRYPAVGASGAGAPSYQRLPEMNVVRNGATSTTTDLGVANGWGGTANNASNGISRDEAIEYANMNFASIGGYEGVKAAVRAKWETTQYMLDKADTPIVQVYRGMSYPHTRSEDVIPAGAAGKKLAAADLETGVSFIKAQPKMEVSTLLDKSGEPQQKALIAEYGSLYNAIGAIHGHDANAIKLHDVIQKVQAVPTPHEAVSYLSGTEMEALTKQYGSFAKAWVEIHPAEETPTRGRVVLRAEVPRTAVLSVPAYGVNVHSEHEVVVTGTSWRGWDAWSDKAPSFEDVPMGTKTSPPRGRL